MFKQTFQTSKQYSTVKSKLPVEVMPKKLVPLPLASCLPEVLDILKSDHIFPRIVCKDKFPMQVFVLSTKKQSDTFISTILQRTGSGGNNTIKFIGLDTETDTRRTEKEKSRIPSTIQVAFGEGLVGVFQIYHMVIRQREAFPTELKRLLENRHIAKVGVGVSKDSEGLISHFATDVIHTVDLDVIGNHMNLQRVSLAALAYLYTGQLMDKRKANIFAPWDDFNLPKSRVQYAAADALFSRLVYERMFRPPLVKISSEELKDVLKLTTKTPKRPLPSEELSSSKRINL